jgi:hypothetical protein
MERKSHREQMPGKFFVVSMFSAVAPIQLNPRNRRNQRFCAVCFVCFVAFVVSVLFLPSAFHSLPSK